MNRDLLQRLQEIGAPDDVKALAEDLIRQAVRDSLTGLYNRRYFDETFAKHIESARRYKRPLSLVLFDMDNLKRINDTAGHEAGDAVLKAFADGLIRTARSADIVCRVGGDEFAVILPETECRDADCFIKRVEKKTARCDIKISVSHGVASLPAKNLFTAADARLYAAKNKRERNE